MITFIRGTVFSFTVDSVVIDNNGIGYYIYFNHPETLTLNQNITVYTYQSFSENAVELYGFSDRKELDVFLKLIKVKGVGPKIAMAMLSKGRYSDMVSAIENGDIDFLKSLPKISTKLAQQIVLDLKGKLVDDVNNVKDSPAVIDAIEGLKALGYKNSEISAVTAELNKMNFTSSNDALKYALQLINKLKGK